MQEQMISNVFIFYVLICTYVNLIAIAEGRFPMNNLTFYLFKWLREIYNIVHDYFNGASMVPFESLTAP